MGENSKIEWTDHTFNPWRGCTKVAEGCKFCYADAQAKRNPGTLGIWGDNGTRVVASESAWAEVQKWNDRAASGVCWHCNGGKKMRTHESGYGYEHCEVCDGRKVIAPYRKRVFCASMADIFEDWDGQLKTHSGSWAVHNRMWGKETDFGGQILSGGSDALHLDGVRRRLFKLIDSTPNLDWLLLTKRPENIQRMWKNKLGEKYANGKCFDIRTRKNVWLGTSIATQADADRNIPELLKCRDLAPVLFVSAEPLLGKVDLSRWLHGKCDCQRIEHGRCHMACPSMQNNQLDWLIVGGESGHNARPFDYRWARSLRDQCQAAGVPFFFKQWGEWAPEEHYDEAPFCTTYQAWADGSRSYRVGKAAAGSTLDGREWKEFPKTSSP